LKLYTTKHQRMANIKLGILRETKNPPDRRVALAPAQAVEFIKEFPHIDLAVQFGGIRAYTDKEYSDLGIMMQEDMSDCDILVGIKEVEKSALIPNKTYMFFSHTAKKQEHNRSLLQAVIENKIRLVDYEYLTDIHGIRLAAFGRWAGIVGAYNGLLGWGKRSGEFNLKRAHQCRDMDEFIGEIKKVKLPAIKILITGGGRVAHGAIETLENAGIEHISPNDFTKKQYDYPVYTQIDPWHYAERNDGSEFDLKHFFKHPYEYKSTFLTYGNHADLLIACHFWDPRSPRFMTREDMMKPEFKMKVIADVSCDIDGPLPSTLRASTIAEPFYGFDCKNNCETEPFAANEVTVMAVDNLPGEAPRNASIDFSKDLINKVFPALLNTDKDDIIKRATIAENGKLTDAFSFLQDFLDEK